MNMKEFATEHRGLVIKSYKENDDFILEIYKKHCFLAATRSGKTAVESTYDKKVMKFASADRANNYFKAIKKNNPTLALVQ